MTINSQFQQFESTDELFMMAIWRQPRAKLPLDRYPEIVGQYSDSPEVFKTVKTSFTQHS